MEELDGASKHFMFSKGLRRISDKLLQAKGEMDAYWKNYLLELERIENLPKDLLKYEFEYRR